MIDFKSALTEEVERQFGGDAVLIKATIQYLENEGLLNHEAIANRYNLIPAGRDFEPAVPPVDYQTEPQSAAEVVADNAGLKPRKK